LSALPTIVSSKTWCSAFNAICGQAAGADERYPLLSVCDVIMSDLVLPSDTSLEAIRVQFAIDRRMPPEQRLRLMCQMAYSARAVAADGVRARHPHYTERQVPLAVIRLRLGEELFRRVYPGVDVAVCPRKSFSYR
jgi:hypothetical protein